MVIVTFAVPQESREFCRALHAAGGRLGGEEVRVAHLGVGPVSAAARIPRWLREKPRLVICAGFAGALDARLKAGDLVLAENFSTPELLDRARTFSSNGAGPFTGALVTRGSPVETAAAKAALAGESRALAVDMETGPVAEACRAAGAPLLAVRAISDTLATPLPVPFSEWFDTRHQRPRTFRLAKYLLLHPKSVGPFAAFLRGLPPARRALRDFLLHFLQRHV
jgi:nucleoside phosphorylase